MYIVCLQGMNVQSGRKWRITGGLFIIALCIKLIAGNSELVEHYYATGVYTVITGTLRVLLGWLPFSFGDLLYAAVVVWLLWLIVHLIRLLVRKQFTNQKLWSGLRRLVNFALLVYLIFNVLWGLNYDREGIAYQLQLNLQDGNEKELHSLAGVLLEKVNACRKQLPNEVSYLSSQNNFSAAVKAYDSAKLQYPFLHYRFSSIKPSLYNILGNYLGFSGYYNPFTAEAQVNTNVPPFLIPYIACHEMAHQLGYASEDEANFAGYLAAKSSHNPQFRYSVYFDLFNYANGELFLHDSLAAKANYRNLDTLVKTDIQAYRRYLQAYKNPLEPIVTVLYGKFLKANNQPAGIKTYSKVTSWLIAFRKTKRRNLSHQKPCFIG